MAKAAGTASPRERYRSQVRAEIKERAWEQIADAGASALSLNAIAKRMGMSGPALYRYYGSRDELITELIRDAYRGLADTVDAAAKDGAGLPELGHTLRRWALDDPQRYLLIFGTPVPGYHAPDDVTTISSEIMSALLDASAKLPDGSPGSPGARPGSPSPSGSPEEEFEQHIDAHRQWAGDHPATPVELHRALSFWTRVHGVLSLELAGHFSGMGFDPATLFEAELAALLRR
ncbi:TetR/AcrR family transcriptional regulator [Streptomyces kanamyceticus]|uniref:TetR/AcrR family transcriptional regulator n=2 Tax=Streptomyces kanamyceticus TaxID=1967 RepID=A0A5J6GJQ7_STRKN|nr:TetR/AcrR family transcriptional regulator [Streptomyces kanamyceticus]QEU96120.1 TetR/AcrR family transcriptional regulator [Streptomyces kanamyceticus]